MQLYNSSVIPTDNLSWVAEEERLLEQPYFIYTSLLND